MTARDEKITELLSRLEQSKMVLAEYGYRFPAIFDALKFLLEDTKDSRLEDALTAPSSAKVIEERDDWRELCEALRRDLVREAAARDKQAALIETLKEVLRGLRGQAQTGSHLEKELTRLIALADGGK